MIAIATRRLGARRKFQARLEAVEGEEGFARQQRYLETVLALSQRGAMARMMRAYPVVSHDDVALLDDPQGA